MISSKIEIPEFSINKELILILLFIITFWVNSLLFYFKNKF